MKILSRPSGEGTDYASMPVLASKRYHPLTVQPLTQEELDTAAAFMKLVCTEDVYWEGIRKANADRDHVIGDMRSFIEIVPATTGYKFIRNMDSYNAVGRQGGRNSRLVRSSAVPLLPLQQQRWWPTRRCG